jgi:SAM-dependent methyltransferase
MEVLRMGLNLIFDRSAEIYDRVRPRYVKAVFEDVAAYAGEDGGKRALEIGAGTGQATEAFLAMGFDVTALEPGADMAEILRRKFGENPRFRVEEALFQDYAGADGFDLIYAATSFHWIPEEVGYPKALSLLKPGGALALFWNHPTPARECAETDREIQAAYAKHTSWPKAQPFNRESLSLRKLALAKYGFRDVEARLYESQRRLSAEEHSLLLDTYSDHLALAPKVRLALKADIASAIDAHGGTITLCDTIDLYLARRPRA